MLLMGVSSISFAQITPMNSPMTGLSGTGVVTGNQVLSFSGGYIVIGKFTGNISALGHTITNMGGEDAFAAVYNTSAGGNQLASVLQLGGNGNDIFSAGDMNNSTCYLGGSHSSSNTIQIKLFRQGFSAIVFSLPNLSKNNTDQIGLIARLNLIFTGTAFTSLNPNPTALKTAKVSSLNTTNARVNGVSFGQNGANSAVFITGESEFPPTFFSSTLSGTTISNGQGPFVARYNTDLLFSSALTGLYNPNFPLTGKGNFVKAVPFGNGFYVYNSGTFQGVTLVPGIGSNYSWDNVYVARMVFPAVGSPSWNWVKNWAINNSLGGAVCENKGLVVTSNSVIVLNLANNISGPHYRNYIVSYNAANGAVNYTNSADNISSHNCLAYNQSSNTLYTGGFCGSSAQSFPTSAQTFITKPAGQTGIYIASHDPATGYCTNLWTDPLASASAGSCNAILATNCTLISTGSVQGTLLGATFNNGGAYLATADANGLRLSPNATVAFCPGVPSGISVSTFPVPMALGSTTWNTTGTGVTITPAGNTASVMVAPTGSNNFFVNINTTVGGCARTGTFTFSRSSGCAEGDIEDRYEGSEDLPSEVKVAPNPFTQQITLSGLNGAQRVEILNLEGKVVFARTSPDSDVLEIHTQDWAVGMYLYRIMDHNSQVTVGKMVKN